ncbi:MAG: dTMP kinase [Candidatus Aenigmatarchaeota archaeon]
MGKYVAIEGIDGAGKTTICKLLSNELKNSIIIREPSDFEIGNFIRNSLKNKKDYMKNPFVSTLLFFADRVSTTNEIRRLKEKHDYIISDRCFLSTYAYQKALLNNEEERKIFENLFNELLKLIEIPDLIIILDVDVEIALQRIEKEGKAKELYENGEFLRKVLENYRNLELDVENVYLIDANRSIEEVKEDVIKVINLL